jgi:hypothetical protein
MRCFDAEESRLRDRLRPVRRARHSRRSRRQCDRQSERIRRRHQANGGQRCEDASGSLWFPTRSISSSRRISMASDQWSSSTYLLVRKRSRRGFGEGYLYLNSVPGEFVEAFKPMLDSLACVKPPWNLTLRLTPKGSIAIFMHAVANSCWDYRISIISTIRKLPPSPLDIGPI